jgi:hypothetical protein
MQKAAAQQLAQDHLRAADVVHVARQVFAAGAQVADQRRAGKYFGYIVQMESDAGLVRNGGDVQRGVGGTTGGRHDGAGVLQRLARDDVARQGSLAHHRRHQRLGRAAHQRRTFAEHRRHHAGANRRQANGLGHHAHGVGGELARAGASCGQAGAGSRPSSSSCVASPARTLPMVS